MEKISQTNRTILFEQINPDKLNLLTIIGETELQNSLSDDMIEEINKELLVESFDDFLIKFEPTIYSYFDANKNKVCYTLEKDINIPSECVTEIRLGKDNAFFRMLLALLDARNNNKVKNVNFNYTDILELLSPKKIIENLKQSRKEINYLYDKYENLDDKNPEKKEIGDKLNYAFLEASKNYNNVLSMLPLAIEDIEVRLSLDKSNNPLNKLDRIKPGLLTIAENGSLEITEINTTSNLLQIESNQKNTENLAQLFIDDYNETVEYKSTYVANLISRSYVPNSVTLNELDIEKEITNYNSYLEIYKQSQDDFITISKELVKKVLGIKIFFDQYNTKYKQMKPKLLITNFKLDLLMNPKSKKALAIYLNTVNNKNDFTNTIWFGILPNVNYDVSIENQKIKKKFMGSDTEEILEKNKFNDILNIADLLEKYKIQLFFNFQASDKTDFKTFSINGVEEYKKKTMVLEDKTYSEYLIPVFPNFTIIPKNKSKVTIGMTKGDENKELFYYINGLYIDASYAAAGLISAYQCPGYLKDRFKNVNPSIPGVRINIESSENSFEIKTTLPKEISGYTVDIKNSINEANYGFVFASENAIYNGNVVDNVTVYKARSMNKSGGYNYEPIYKTLTCTYIERIMRYETTDFKEDRLNFFFSSSPNSTKSLWSKNSMYVNAILRAEDDMTYSIDSNTCSLNLSFAGDVKHLNLMINSKE
ncbi:transcriptional regulator [uncultured Sneathia sp.]|uniref:transcriptional regulator n=1 Tax=uncultured Sneathia sp. TaxID=278067 RepID=UPI00259B9AB0|nr:transcriptional regulator [uncultured Sneathia sp.]